MLTEGFLRGWLTFDSKTSTSKLRQEYILTVLERDLLLNVSSVKLGAVAALVGGNPSRQSVGVLTQDLQQHAELALPYLVEKTRIRNTEAAAKANDPAFWRNLLAQRREDTEKSKDEPVELAPVAL